MRSMRRPRSASACAGARRDFCRLARPCSSGLRPISRASPSLPFRILRSVAVLILPLAAIAAGLLAYRDRLAGVSAFGRERRLFLDDHAGARRCWPSRSPPPGIRSPAASTGSRAFPVCPAWTTSPTSIMSRPRSCSPCWRLPAGSTTRRSACSGGRWRRTSVACNCSASTPISSKPWRSASAD